MLGILAVSLIVFAILVGLLGREFLLDRRARRRKAELDANIIHADAWVREEVRDSNGKKTIEYALLDRTKPLWRVNSHLRQPEPFETQAHIIEHAPRQVTSQATTMPLQGESSSLDLLTIFTQPTQSYAIIAGQQVGKTFQARRIAQHWLSTGCKPIAIGPKWDKGEWEGCTLFGGEYNLQQVNRGMQIVKRLAEDRHSDKNLSHKQHPIQPVFFDDWTAIAAELLEAEEFILKATTLFASVNIILYFMIHLDTANAWGVHKIGAALKNNFVKLLIYPGYDEAGLIDRNRNRGYIIRPGETIKDKKQVSLFSGTGSQLLLPDLVIQPPNGEAQQIIEMIDSGISYKDISESIWGTGKYGKFYNEKIDRILSKYTPRIS